jgi:acylphosphatase
VSDQQIGRQRLEASIRGTVQGVGFRWFVVRNAVRLGLTGWTANQADGSVRVVAEGPPPVLDQFVALLQEGPAGAHVDRVKTVRTPATGSFKTFGIKSGSHRGD